MGNVNLWANKTKHNLMRIYIDYLRTMQETARRDMLVKKIRQYRTTEEHHSQKKQNPLKKDSNFYFHHKHQKEFMSLNILLSFK